MSEREWIVVRDGNGVFFVTVRVTQAKEDAFGWAVVGKSTSFEYADGFADALNLAAEDRSVLPEWNG